MADDQITNMYVPGKPFSSNTIRYSLTSTEKYYTDTKLYPTRPQPKAGYIGKVVTFPYSSTRQYYFVLYDGELKYYSSSATTSIYDGIKLCGHIKSLKWMKVRDEGQLVVISHNTKIIMTLKFDQKNDRNAWMMAFNEHIDYEGW